MDQQDIKTEFELIGGPYDGRIKLMVPRSARQKIELEGRKTVFHPDDYQMKRPWRVTHVYSRTPDTNQYAYVGHKAHG